MSFDEHRDEAKEELFAEAMVDIGDELHSLAGVEERGGLGRGPTNGLVEAPLVRRGELACALRNVEHDR